jgi:hypothetical protein
MYRHLAPNLLCTHCGEPFDWFEYGVITHCVEADGAGACIAYHDECQLRQVLGSRMCSCYGGDQEDAPELSVRDAARAAVAIWEEINERTSS